MVQEDVLHHKLIVTLNHTVPSMHYGLFGDPTSKPARKLIPQMANLTDKSGNASNDKRRADISSLDNVRIKSLRPAIIKRRMNNM